uniref:Nonstructural protein 8 n=1 Tax=Alphacoronavirus sp. TaxID=1906673 RepID=A0A8F0ZWN9_9ALPC|nr:nonstructural protein 8 [Alphacoronavirus sp.]
MKLFLLLCLFGFSLSAPTTYRASEIVKLPTALTEKVTFNNQRTYSYTNWFFCTTYWNTYTNTLVVVNGRWSQTAKPPRAGAVAIPTVPFYERSQTPERLHFDYGRVEYESVMCATFEHVQRDIHAYAAKLSKFQRRNVTYAVTVFKWDPPSN